MRFEAKELRLFDKVSLNSFSIGGIFKLTPTEIVPEEPQIPPSSDATKEPATEKKTVTRCCGGLESVGCDTLIDDDDTFFSLEVRLRV